MCSLSLRKGSAKTEKAAWIAIAELHPEGPVRCDGFDAKGHPVGRGVTDPYIPMMAYTEEQTEELAYGALRRILEECAIGNDFDVGLERVLRKDGRGKCEAVASSPNARDGARTTFVHFDETHRWTLPSLRSAWKVSRNNLAKRPMADPWGLETTTAPEPGGGSVGEDSLNRALKLLEDPPATEQRFFFFHREASDHHDLDTDEGLHAAIVEASGPYIAKWTDVGAVALNFLGDPADRAYAERVWLNRRVQAAERAFDLSKWNPLALYGHKVKDGAAITLGFDGSRYDDATGLVATEISTGFQWVVEVWQRPDSHHADAQGDRAWEVPAEEVDQVVADAFDCWQVVRMYCDPPKWEGWVSTWAGRYGEKVVLEWWTNRRKPMAFAIRSWSTAIEAGELAHSGDSRLTAHVGNAYRHYTKLVDDEEKPLWVLRKERPDSPHKIDLAMAAILSWEARNDAVAAGDGETREYEIISIAP